jgi:CO/xanthine dehydrogenase FAD-binding subunit
MDLAIIGTAAWVRMDGNKIEDCRIALGCVAVNAIRAPKAEAFLKDKELTDEVLEQAGNLKQTLKELNRETYDYREFLKKFASLGENLETNEDEFDYIYYI